MNLEADMLHIWGIGKNRALVLYHRLCDLMLGASCGLEASETVLTKQRKPEQT